MSECMLNIVQACSKYLTCVVILKISILSTQTFMPFLLLYFRLYFFGQRVLMISDREMLKEIFIKDFDSFCDRMVSNSFKISSRVTLCGGCFMQLIIMVE